VPHFGSWVAGDDHVSRMREHPPRYLVLNATMHVSMRHHRARSNPTPRDSEQRLITQSGNTPPAGGALVAIDRAAFGETRVCCLRYASAALGLSAAVPSHRPPRPPPGIEALAALLIDSTKHAETLAGACENAAIPPAGHRTRHPHHHRKKWKPTYSTATDCSPDSYLMACGINAGLRQARHSRSSQPVSPPGSH